MHCTKACASVSMAISIARAVSEDHKFGRGDDAVGK